MLNRVQNQIKAWHTGLFLRRPYWTSLRSVGNAPAAQAVILIPILGYWIIFNEHIAGRYANLTGEVIQGAQGNPPWRLFLTYFALCFVAVASAFYRWRCPSEIKLYPAESEYVGRISPEISGIELMRVKWRLRTVMKKASVDMSDYKKQLKRHPLHSFKPPAMASREIPLSVLKLCNRSSPIARMIVITFYAVGFLILFLLSLEVFWRVTKAMLVPCSQNSSQRIDGLNALPHDPVVVSGISEGY